MMNVATAVSVPSLLPLPQRAALIPTFSIMATAFHHCPFSLWEKVGMRAALSSILSRERERRQTRKALVLIWGNGERRLF